MNTKIIILILSLFLGSISQAAGAKKIKKQFILDHISCTGIVIDKDMNQLTYPMEDVKDINDRLFLQNPPYKGNREAPYTYCANWRSGSNSLDMELYILKAKSSCDDLPEINATDLYSSYHAYARVPVPSSSNPKNHISVINLDGNIQVDIQCYYQD